MGLQEKTVLMWGQKNKGKKGILEKRDDRSKGLEKKIWGQVFKMIRRGYGFYRGSLGCRQRKACEEVITVGTLQLQVKEKKKKEIIELYNWETQGTGFRATGSRSWRVIVKTLSLPPSWLWFLHCWFHSQGGSKLLEAKAATGISRIHHTNYTPEGKKKILKPSNGIILTLFFPWHLTLDLVSNLIESAYKRDAKSTHSSSPPLITAWSKPPHLCILFFKLKYYIHVGENTTRHVHPARWIFT